MAGLPAAYWLAVKTVKNISKPALTLTTLRPKLTPGEKARIIERLREYYSGPADSRPLFIDTVKGE